MKKLFGIFTLLLVAASGFGQVQFIRSYGSSGFDYGRDIVEDVNNNFFVTGSSSSFSTGTADAFIMKTTPNGAFTWSYSYGGSGADWGEQLIFTLDSGFAMAGHTTSWGEGGFDFYLVRANSTNGAPLWQKTYGGSDWDRAYDLVQLEDSGFVLVGETYSFNGGVRSGYIVRTDKNGDTLWTKVLSGANEMFLTGIEIDLAGDSIVIAGGSKNGGAGGMDGYLAKLDTAGNIGWEQYYGGLNDDYFNDVSHLDMYYACAGALGTGTAGDEDAWVLKVDYQTGALIWEMNNSAESIDQDVLNSVRIREIGPGDVLYAGQTKSYDYSLFDGEEEFYYGKYDVDGVFLTQNNYGDKGFDAAHSIRDTYDTGAVIVGDTKEYAYGGGNILIVKIQASWNEPNILTDLTYMQITNGIVETDINTGLRLYPNPVNDILIIESKDDILSAKLYSMQGKLLLEVHENIEILNLSNFETGSYVLLLDLNGQFYSKLILKD
ncbi:T9SS type A sorting domain-containing protein [bacterium AH-315-B15]|nr:T9SS type A sorting domain-containing protein [bacterium AH-315-B15]